MFLNLFLHSRSCTSELQLKVNCSKKFGLGCQLLAEPAQILSYNSLSVYNSLSAAIQLYMIRPLDTFHFEKSWNLTTICIQPKAVPNSRYPIKMTQHYEWQGPKWHSFKLVNDVPWISRPVYTSFEVKHDSTGQRKNHRLLPTNMYLLM